MAETTIEWATHVWNPFTGCDRVSPGCANCYALTSAASLQRRERGRIAKAEREGKPRPKVRYQRDGERKSSGPGFGFTVHWDKLEHYNFPAGARVFVNSMSDVFHEEAPIEAIAQLWRAFASKPNVKFLVLTKRPERMLKLFEAGLRFEVSLGREKLAPLPWPLPNVWLGVTIENRRFVHRADLLRQTPAAVRFISAEPLLGPLVGGVASGAVGEPRAGGHGGTGRAAATAAGPTSAGGQARRHSPLDLTNIDWLIVGGESGPGHRRIDPDWVRDLRDACVPDPNACRKPSPGGPCALFKKHTVECMGVENAPTTAFFFKQWGGRTAKEGGRELDGRTWDEFPDPKATASA